MRFRKGLVVDGVGELMVILRLLLFFVCLFHFRESTAAMYVCSALRHGFLYCDPLHEACRRTRHASVF